eukprot:TRINITY_DN65710_c0_g1_i1.p3 TRINITY_DN65710_c0_g1~~TRINITY_DN65710_c0_g1_i1.p3  ORF type:complete len:251 (-),score=63.51 TRINITY_DN65710_c0_g1_i1:1623-2375(-)
MKAAVLGGAFAAALSLYAATCYRSVAGGDSAEFVTLAKLFPRAIAHPPGYPLYTILLAAFVAALEPHLTAPDGSESSVAFAANLLSAVLGALAVSLQVALAGELCELVGRGLGDPARWRRWRTPSALLSGAFFATHPTVWLYALQAEVFALNNALLSALALLFVRAARQPFAAAAEPAAAAKAEADIVVAARGGSWGHARGGAVLIGLALSNQHTAPSPSACLFSWRFRRARLGVHGDGTGQLPRWPLAL